jgi:hypothetical protein
VKYLSKYHSDMLNAYAQITNNVFVNTIAIQADQLQRSVQEFARNTAENSAATGRITPAQSQSLKQYDSTIIKLTHQINTFPDFRNDVKLMNALNILNATKQLITTLMRTYKTV